MDYFSRSRASSRAAASTPDNASTHTGTSEIPPTPPAIRIRRLPSTALFDQSGLQRIEEDGDGTDSKANRRRSMSLPEQRRPDYLPSTSSNDLRRQNTAQTSQAAGLETVREEQSAGTSNQHTPAAEPSRLAPPTSNPPPSGRTGRRRAATAAGPSGRPPFMSGNSILSSIRSGRSSRSPSVSSRAATQQEYDREIVDLLDVIDPEVSTLTTLNNVQNSLFVPYLGRYFSRTPTYDLTRVPSIRQEVQAVEAEIEMEHVSEEKDDTQTERPLSATESIEVDPETQKAQEDGVNVRPLSRSHTISSVLKDDKYAVLPHGDSLKGWTNEEIDELNDHVRHMMHSRRSRFKRGMKGFWRYFRTPLGFFVTVYSFLITFWGAAWVIFLIGWINVGDRREYFIEICDQILTAMLVVFGITLAPFRCVDTYHMGYIAYYHRLTWRKRKERALPELADPNDLPEVDVEAMDPDDPDAVLTAKQLELFYHHQAKFARAHTYYRPHETYTHRAFPLWVLITVVALLDAHSCFQIALGGTTWGIYYRKRGHILTTVLLACSLTCNITGGIMISIGDKLSRKKEIKEQMYRQALTAEAMKAMKKQKGWEAPKSVSIEPQPKKKHWWKANKGDGEASGASTASTGATV